jgi:hypothetical protein
MSGYLADAGVNVAETRTAYAQLQDLNKRYGDMLIDGGLAAGGLAPPPWGTFADVASLGRSWTNGTWGDVFFDVIGFVPVLDLVKGARTGLKVNDIRRGVDAANTAMGRVFQTTKDTAAKYWADMAKARKAAYDEAVKKCNGKKACLDKLPSPKGPQYDTLPKDPNKGSWTPKDGSPAVTYKNGFPDFKPFSKADVEIPMRGNSTDFTAADKAMQARTGDANWQRPDGYTWHHKEDGVTMQLVPSSINTASYGGVNHTGGAALFGKVHGEGF